MATCTRCGHSTDRAVHAEERAARRKKRHRVIFAILGASILLNGLLAFAFLGGLSDLPEEIAKRVKPPLPGATASASAGGAEVAPQTEEGDVVGDGDAPALGDGQQSVPPAVSPSATRPSPEPSAPGPSPAPPSPEPTTVASDEPATDTDTDTETDTAPGGDASNETMEAGSASRPPASLWDAAAPPYEREPPTSVGPAFGSEGPLAQLRVSDLTLVGDAMYVSLILRVQQGAPDRVLVFELDGAEIRRMTIPASQDRVETSWPMGAPGMHFLRVREEGSGAYLDQVSRVIWRWPGGIGNTVGIRAGVPHDISVQFTEANGAPRDVLYLFVDGQVVDGTVIEDEVGRDRSVWFRTTLPAGEHTISAGVRDGAMQTARWHVTVEP